MTRTHNIRRRGPAVLFLLIARTIALLAFLGWVGALALVLLIGQEVSYTVCNGPLLQLPPPTIHIPPIGHHLDLVPLQGTINLMAVGLSILASFLLLYAAPHIRALYRTGLLLMTIAASFTGAAILWLVVHYDLLNAHLQAVIRCL